MLSKFFNCLSNQSNESSSCHKLIYYYFSLISLIKVFTSSVICPHGLRSNVQPKVLKCLEQARAKQYKKRVEHIQFDYLGQTSIQLVFNFSSNTRWVHEEYYLFDEIGLLGSIGGSLGLFIGFSFFDYLSKILDVFASAAINRFSVSI